MARRCSRFRRYRDVALARRERAFSRALVFQIRQVLHGRETDYESHDDESGRGAKRKRGLLARSLDRAIVSSDRRERCLPEHKFSAAKANLLSIRERSWFVGDSSISNKSTVTRIRIDQLPPTLSALDDRMPSRNGGIPHD